MSAIAITAIVPAWTGSDTTRSAAFGDRADHVQRDDRDADVAQLLGRLRDVAAHDRPGEDQQAGARQVGHRAHGGRDVLLADERDRVDEIRSPRRLWRSASLTAPSATWATCAPPPTTMTRLPKTRSSARVSRWLRTSGRVGHGRDQVLLGRGPRPRPRARPAAARRPRAGPSRCRGSCRRRRRSAATSAGMTSGRSANSRRMATVGGTPGRRGDIGRQRPTFMPRSARPALDVRRTARRSPPVGSCSSKASPSAPNAARVWPRRWSSA